MYYEVCQMRQHSVIHFTCQEDAPGESLEVKGQHFLGLQARWL